MRIFIKTILMLCLVLSGACLAAVPTPIEGETTDGWEIFVDAEAFSDPPISIRKTNDDTYKTYQKFTGEHCVFAYEDTPTLTCPSSAKSPLAGTKYVGHRNSTGNCERGDPEYIYVCVSGCNKRAPLKLFQGHYEC